MTDLRPGWTTTTISELGGVVGGKTPSKANSSYWQDGTIPWVSPKDMKVFDLQGSEDLITRSAIDDGGMKVLPKGSLLLVTRSGILAHTLPVAITACPVTINQDIKAIPPIEGFISSRFLAYNLRSLEANILNDCCKAGTTVASVEMGLFERLPIAIAPQAEQQRITDKLDTVLARVDACRDRLARVAPLLKRFRQSVLAAATSGRLTEDWKGSDQSKWRNMLLAEIALKLHQGINTAADKIEYKNSGHYILQAKHVTNGAIEIGDARMLSSDDFAIYRDRFSPRIGDILFTNIGTIGKSVVVTSNADILFAWNVFLIRLRGGFDARFIRYHLELLRLNGFYESLYRGGATQFINKKQIGEIEVAIPPIAEQIEIVRRVGALFAFADRLEARLVQARSAAERLTPALLAKAFRGELVPQDPADEPAAVLLKRLAAGTLQNSAKRTRRSSTAGAAPASTVKVPTIRT
jgi:type I restriction enzyme S subunit